MILHREAERRRLLFEKHVTFHDSINNCLSCGCILSLCSSPTCRGLGITAYRVLCVTINLYCAKLCYVQLLTVYQQGTASFQYKDAVMSASLLVISLLPILSPNSNFIPMSVLYFCSFRDIAIQHKHRLCSQVYVKMPSGYFIISE